MGTPGGSGSRTASSGPATGTSTGLNPFPLFIQTVSFAVPGAYQRTSVSGAGRGVPGSGASCSRLKLPTTGT